MKPNSLPFRSCRCVKHSGCAARIQETAQAFDALVNALQAMEEYARFMFRHQATDLGVDSTPPLKLIEQALRGAGRERQP